jgi:serine/threonine-protein kinase
MAVLAALGVLVVVVLGVALAMQRNNDKTPSKSNTSPPVAQAQMPDLHGLSDDQARSKLEQAGLKNIQPQSPTTGPDCNGTVANQNPSPNQQVSVDTTVTYQLCQAPAPVTVPTGLVGGTEQNAVSALTAVGLQPNVKRVDDTHQAGTVLSVESEGKKVDPGSTITVRVSKGNLVPMPDLTGKSFDVAQGVLQSLVSGGGININQKSVPGDGTQPPGTVVGQNPKPGTPIGSGDNVTLTVVADPNPSDSASTPAGGDNGGNGGGTGIGLLNDAVTTRD